MLAERTLKYKPVRITKTSDRGFHQYGTLAADSYGITFRVIESSSASGPHVWLFIVPTPDIQYGNCLHMNKKQATELIRRLQTWIDEIPDRWDNG